MSTNVLTAGYSKSAETDAGDSFVDATIMCLMLIALPIKNFAYLVPPIFFVLQAAMGNVGFVRRTFLWGTLAFSISALSITIDSLPGPHGQSTGADVWCADVCDIGSDFGSASELRDFAGALAGPAERRGLVCDHPIGARDVAIRRKSRSRIPCAARSACSISSAVSRSRKCT